VSFTATSKVPVKADCVLEPNHEAYRQGGAFSDQAGWSPDWPPLAAE
jgi:hypothetical protein